MIGRVYRIVHLESELCYIGSTANELRFRWQGHKSAYNQWLKGKATEVSIYPHFKEHGIDKFKIILVKEYQVEDRKHLLAYEQLWISKFRKTTVNKINSFEIKRLSQNPCSHEQYIRTRESRLAAQKRYYQKIRKKRLAKQKEYDDAHRDQISTRHKEKKIHLPQDQKGSRMRR
ncbi:TPA: hypothetical protein N0F65_011613 [Lagenidium giganteum]|uniref:GIY-YIG domain-containing protein n=1 Tax=Lagenidium giganteum TaxID=4803 RepID=A0AAV2ZD60_9STRA|nr:TPA: hypothetical protein N0F65_011613 [Lagenidium giganteum]